MLYLFVGVRCRVFVVSCWLLLFRRWLCVCLLCFVVVCALLVFVVHCSLIGAGCSLLVVFCLFVCVVVCVFPLFCF